MKRDSAPTSRRRDRGSREFESRGQLINLLAFDSTLSRREEEPEPPQMGEQYSIQGRIRPLYFWSNCSEGKNSRNLNRTPSFLEAALATIVICGFQESLLFMFRPRMLMSFTGETGEPSKRIGKLVGVFEREM